MERTDGDKSTAAVATTASIATADATAPPAATVFPLHLAAMRGDCWEMKKLLDNGADVNALDHHGRTVVACAVIGEESVAPRPLSSSLADRIHLNVQLGRPTALHPLRRL